jgi:hypothetical protein
MNTTKPNDSAAAIQYVVVQVDGHSLAVADGNRAADVDVLCKRDVRAVSDGVAQFRFVTDVLCPSRLREGYQGDED